MEDGTEAVISGGDAASDICFWIHPVDPALSTIIAGDKDLGLYVQDLEGNTLQIHPDGKVVSG